MDTPPLFCPWLSQKEWNFRFRIRLSYSIRKEATQVGYRTRIYMVLLVNETQRFSLAMNEYPPLSSNHSDQELPFHL